MTDPDLRTQQVPTGIPGLDRLLRGGIRRSGLHVLLGRAGAGKSVVAHQLGAHHIREGGTVLYLTVLVETHQTLISQARTFRFFDPSTISHGFYYASLYPAMERDGLEGMGAEITRLVRERSPSLLILDGLHALKLAASSQLDYQRWIHELEAQAAVTGMTMLLLTHPRRDGSDDPTFTIADGIIAIRSLTQQLRRVRLISVVKLRGVAHICGWHTTEITADGMSVYPRLESLVAADGLSGVVPTFERCEFAVAGLGEMMGGGVASGSVTFVVGTPGSGKTFLGLAFLSGGVAQGERGLFFGFHETPDRLLLKADAIGLPLRQAVEDGLLELHWQPPSELLSDELADRILRIVEARGVRRLMLDGFDQLKQGTMMGERSQQFFSAFCDLLRARGVAVVLTQDLRRVAGDCFDVPVAPVSQSVDNIIHLRSTEIHARFRRLISILKVRDRSYDRSAREFRIGSDGIRIGEVVGGREGLPDGEPRFPEARPNSIQE